MSKCRIDIAMMGKQHWPDRETGGLTQRGRQTDRPYRHTNVYKVLRFSTDWLSFLCLSLSLSTWTKCLYAKSSQPSITMMCKSIINYKYSIASLQSATEIGVDNLQKQKVVFFCCFFFKLCVCVSVFVWVSVHEDLGLKSTMVRLCAFGCLAQSVELSLV